MIDFSKAPESATHYIKGGDVIKTELLIWKIKEVILWSNGSDFTWGLCEKWFPISNLTLSTPPKEISASEVKKMIEVSTNEIPQQLTVTCDNERQKMLCEQVIRMCRGEAGDMLNVNNEWVNKSSLHALDIRYEYRAKPKKELVVPWDVLADEVEEIRVDSNGCIYDGNTPLRIKLDLDGVSLPVTVKRPEVV